MSERRTVLFVLCPGHSGSTLLGHVLGAHPQAVHVGEIPTPLRRGRPFLCRVCEGAACPIWGGALPEPLVRAALRRFRRERWLPAPLHGLGGGDLRCALHRRVFDALPRTRLVVDSSKTLAWARWNRGGGRELRVVWLHLRRDLRGVLASHLARDRPASATATTRSLVAHTRRILRLLEGVEAGDRLSIRYEDLVTRPEEVVGELSGELGLAFDPAMLDYYKSPQHVIGGNPGPTYQVRSHLGRARPDLEFLDTTSTENQRYYREGRPGFRLDERWRQRLTGEMLADFERLAGPLNRRLGYGE